MSQRIDPPRALGPNEAEVLRRLVASALPADLLVAQCQVDHIQVVEQDPDGSLILAVDRGACPPFDWLHKGMLVNASNLRRDQMIEVLLHAKDGYLWYLEVVTNPTVALGGLPQADSLTYLGGYDQRNPLEFLRRQST